MMQSALPDFEWPFQPVDPALDGILEHPYPMTDEDGFRDSNGYMKTRRGAILLRPR